MTIGDAAGMQPKSVDVAIASRSIATHDLAAALLKLDRTARRRCCITLIATGSPRVDRHIMDAIGASVTESHDYVYAFQHPRKARKTSRGELYHLAAARHL